MNCSSLDAGYDGSVWLECINSELHVASHGCFYRHCDAEAECIATVNDRNHTVAAAARKENGEVFQAPCSSLGVGYGVW